MVIHSAVGAYTIYKLYSVAIPRHPLILSPAVGIMFVDSYRKVRIHVSSDTSIRAVRYSSTKVVSGWLSMVTVFAIL